MGKSIVVNGTIIQVHPLGEKNFLLQILTIERGIISATLYGGPKSRLKSLASEWNGGILYLSEEKNGNFLKLNDFDVKKYHETFRTDIFKMWAASLAAEIAIKTKCADSPEECYEIFSGFIDGLELCQTKEAGQKGLIRFLWRYLKILGLQPDASSCSQCGTSFFARNLSSNNIEYNRDGANYLPMENSFVCTNCIQENTPFFLDIDAIQYLGAVSSLKPAQARIFPLSKQGAGQLKELLLFLCKNACGIQLKTLESGLSIL